jgi:hypothetical protein
MERLSRKLSLSPDKVLCSSRGIPLRRRSGDPQAMNGGGATTARNVKGGGAETARASAMVAMVTARTSVTVATAPASRVLTQWQFGVSLSPRSPRGMAALLSAAEVEDSAAPPEEQDHEDAESLFEEAPQVSDAALMQSILRQGNHIVIMGLRGYVLQPIVRIIRTLTSEHLPARFRQVPIVIVYYSENPLASDKALRMLKGTCPSLVFVNARPLKLESLLLAGVDRCSKLIVMSGPSDGNMMASFRQEPVLMDRDLILLLSVLDSQSKLYWGSMPTLIFSLEVPQNATLISEGIGAEEAEAEATGAAQDGSAEQDRLQGQEPTVTCSAQQVRTHVKYASGQLIPRPALCSLFAANYHNPAVLDLLQSMTRAAPDGNTSSVWKIPLPPKTARGGKSFETLFQEFVESDAIPIGIYRKPGGPSADDKIVGSDSPVVVTCPPAASMVQDGDEIYVIATSDFYSKHMEQMSQLDTFTPRPTTARSRKSTARMPPFASAVPVLGLPPDTDGPSTERARPQSRAAPPAGQPPLTAGREAAARAYSTHCPRGHMLKVIITPVAGWGCDACQTQGFEKGTKMWGCRKCRWVSCSACRKKNPDPELLQLCMSSRRKSRSGRESARDKGTGAETVRTQGGSAREA